LTGPAAPPVSVCVPVYNGQNYLAEALDSILSQTWNDFELLIVDNASTDGTPAIIEKYAARDARVRAHISASNIGLNSNLNRCIALARGTWIKFLFHDDLMRSECLAKFMAAVEARDRFVCCRRELLIEGDVDIESDVDDAWRDFYLRHAEILAATFSQGERLSAEEAGRWILGHLLANVFGEPISMMFRRDVAIEWGGFNDDLTGWTDLEFAQRIASNTGVRLIDEPLVIFRAHGASSSTTEKVDPLRAFRAEHVQAVITLHGMNFSRAYARLREVSRSCVPPVDLRATLERRVRAAVECIRKHAKTSESEAAEMQVMLDATLERFPGARVAGVSFPLYQKVRRVSRLFK